MVDIILGYRIYIGNTGKKSTGKEEQQDEAGTANSKWRRKDNYVSDRSKATIWRQRKRQRESMYQPNPGPVGRNLLTCAQLFPPSCPHKEAVNGCVCVDTAKGKQKAEGREKEWEEGKHPVTSAVRLHRAFSYICWFNPVLIWISIKTGLPN